MLKIEHSSEQRRQAPLLEEPFSEQNHSLPFSPEAQANDWQPLADQGVVSGSQPDRDWSSVVVGRADFYWSEELSENGQKLMELLIAEMGDSDLLPIYAEEDGFELDAALEELRGHGLLDESNPNLIKLVSRRI